MAFTYGTATTNNGNVTSQVISHRPQDLASPLTQSYTYVDPANRLTYFGENSTLPPQTYAYDAFGNRAVTSGSLNGDNSLTPQTLGYNNHNQWPSFTYDLAGNEKSDGGNSGASYDVENRLSQITNSSGAITTFAYDGEGRRVQKTVGSATTTYVYDAAGKVAAEYSTVAPPFAGIECLTADHLGSTRLTTDSDGNPVQCHDYLPFGEEISPVLTAIRTGCYLGADGVTHKFTGKERDSETGLDFMEARYFSGAQGRFTSVDPENSGSNPYDPQSWNGYAYGRNNPLKYTDPTGTNYTVCDAQGQNCRDFDDKTWEQFAKDNNIHSTPGGSLSVVNQDGSTTPVGSAQYYDEKKQASDVQGAQFIYNQAGPPVKAMAAVTLAFVGVAGAVALMPEAAGASGFIPQVANFATKQAAKAAVQAMKLPVAQASAAISAIARATSSSSIQVLKQGGEVIVRIARAGANGYQVVESVIDQAGGKQVVQKAYDAANNLVHYDPKN